MNRPVSDTAAALIAQLGLGPHPEGGHFRETYRHRPADGSRGHATLIYYLLQAGEVSHWHRVNDADELWLFHAGSPLELLLAPEGGKREERRLGTDVANGEEPQILIERGVWQSARSLGLYTLAACMVTPAFDFAGFEMAPPGWSPLTRAPSGAGAGRYPSPRGWRRPR
ncbi:MAG TPA: cupin domain-containing protein [Dongiaceae bacterium]